MELVVWWWQRGRQLLQAAFAGSWCGLRRGQWNQVGKTGINKVWEIGHE